MPMHKGGKSGQKKHGRNKKWCEMYRARDRRGKNKAIKIRRHLERYPDDLVALKALEVVK